MDIKQIYLDNNSTTKIDDEVFTAMEPYLKELYGNPSSIHWAGRGPRKAIDEAREQVAKFLNCSPMEIVFTSCASEANNLAIKGAMTSKKAKGKHIITTKVEHPSVLTTVKYMERTGFEVTYLDVDSEGMIDLDELKNAIREDTALITIMFANNETGVVFPVKEIGEIAKEHKVMFHTDAVQGAGKMVLDVKELNCDFLSLSGHKLHAPKGVGVMFLKKGVRVVPLIHGGHHERNRRGGTENVAGIVAFGKACEVAARDMEKVVGHMVKLRNKLETELTSIVPFAKINGRVDKRIPNTANIGFEFIEGEGVLLSMDMLGIAASSGSACTSGSLEPSHVLTSMGIPHEVSHGSIRFSLSKWTTEEEIDFVIEKIPAIIDRMRAMSPLWDAKAGKGAEISY